jgi:hypothetical protein
MNNKRKLLLALSGASATAVWAKPIVTAVVLPSHAITSPGSSCFPLTVPGRVSSCRSPYIGDLLHILLDPKDSFSCPSILTVPGASDVEALYGPSSFNVYGRPSGGTHNVTVSPYVGESIDANICCADCAPIDPEGFQGFIFTLQSYPSGALHRVAGSLLDTVEVITLSDLVITPV